MSVQLSFPPMQMLDKNRPGAAGDVNSEQPMPPQTHLLPPCPSLPLRGVVHILPIILCLSAYLSHQLAFWDSTTGVLYWAKTTSKLQVARVGSRNKHPICCFCSSTSLFPRKKCSAPSRHMARGASVSPPVGQVLWSLLCIFSRTGGTKCTSAQLPGLGCIDIRQATLACCLLPQKSIRVSHQWLQPSGLIS